MAPKDSENENGVNEGGFHFRKKIKRTKWENFKRALYNPETNEVLGRTGKNWGQLLVFYTIFYIVLAALFAICMQGLLATLDDREPRWQLEKSLIGTNPGLGFRPISDKTEDGSLIWFDKLNGSTSQKWISLIDKFLEPYTKVTLGDNIKPCSFENGPQKDEVCSVNVTHAFGNCQPNNAYGYKGSNPCIFLKLNKIFGWEPDFYTEPHPDMSSELKEVIANQTGAAKKQVWISCEGQEPFDKEHELKFNYHPSRGFPWYYFPYRNTKNYLSPLIAVEILHATPNVIISIECRAWAKNIHYHGGDRQREGSTHFEILIDDKNVKQPS